VKNNYLRRAKIFLNTSENEPFGLVIIEAMAYGVLPIAHNLGGPSEILPRDFYTPMKKCERINKKIYDRL